MVFKGFSTETMDFLLDLRKNNNKQWFDAHQVDYKSRYVAEAKAFVEAAGKHLVSIEPEIKAEPKFLGSIFRINRDTRFSKDKKPYKDHIDHYKRIPKPYDESAIASRFLLFNALYVHCEEPAGMATSPKLLATCVKHWKKLAPLHRWLVDNVQR